MQAKPKPWLRLAPYWRSTGVIPRSFMRPRIVTAVASMRTRRLAVVASSVRQRAPSPLPSPLPPVPPPAQLSFGRTWHCERKEETRAETECRSSHRWCGASAASAEATTSPYRSSSDASATSAACSNRTRAPPAPPPSPSNVPRTFSAGSAPDGVQSDRLLRPWMAPMQSPPATRASARRRIEQIRACVYWT